MRRLSIRRLMAVIVGAALYLAALRDANEIWAGSLLLVAVGAVAVAVLGSFILRGKRRTWWAGFALFGGGYLALTLGPGLGDAFGPRLGTTHLLEYVHANVVASSISDIVVSRADSGSVLYRVVTTDGGIHERTVARTSYNPRTERAILASIEPTNLWRTVLPGAANHDPFLQVGHCLFSLLAGLMGGMVAAWFWERRKDGEAASVAREVGRGV